MVVPNDNLRELIERAAELAPHIAPQFERSWKYRSGDRMVRSGLSHALAELCGDDQAAALAIVSHVTRGLVPAICGLRPVGAAADAVASAYADSN